VGKVLETIADALIVLAEDLADRGKNVDAETVRKAAKVLFDLAST
jgi:hypothetical protein